MVALTSGLPHEAAIYRNHQPEEAPVDEGRVTDLKDPRLAAFFAMKN